MLGWAQSMSRTYTATAAAAGVAAAIVMGETNRLIGSALTADGHVGTMRGVISPGAWGARDTWQVWQALGETRMSVAWWVGVHTLADVFFYLAYVAVLMRVFGWASPTARRLLRWLLAAEVVETVFLALSAGGLALDRAPTVLHAVVAVAATVKWLLVLALAVTLLRSPEVRAWAPARARLLWTAVKYQRGSAVPVVLLGLLCTVPGPNIWDQLPDVQRAWVGTGARGVGHAVLAFAATAVMAFLLLVLGRHRTRRARLSRGEGKPPTEPAVLWIWLVGPAVVGAVAVGLALGGPDGTVDAAHVALFAAVPLAVYGSSWWLRRRGRPLWSESGDAPGYRNPPLVDEVGRVGDGLALAMVVVTGWGLVRAFTAPALLAGGTQRFARAALLLLGIGLAVAAFPVGRRLLAGLPSFVRPLLAPDDEDSGGLRWVPWLARALFGLALVVFAGLMLAADVVAGALGGIATVTLAVGTWVVLLGFLVVYLQDRQPPEVFRLVRMRAVPVLTLVAVVPATAAVLLDQGPLHHVRTLGPAQAPPRRLVLSEAFEQWLDGSGACDRQVAVPDGPVTVRPMVVAAASGGGIRAAFWTVLGLDALTDSGPCGERLTLLSSGVSGGSVGLAVARQTSDPVAAVRRLSESDALALGVGGMVVGDLFAGITGVRVPVMAGHRDRPNTWTDRAGLMEREWEQHVPELAAPWDPEVRGPGGALLLNSTATDLGCRVVVSQVELGSETSGGTNCRTRSGLPAATLDLFTTYDTCSPALRWSTASMLSARFPFVTPAGRVPRAGDCVENSPDLQFIDGGYAEASGVGTLAELAPDLAALVRAHNASGGGPVVVPLVVYFEDEHASDVSVAPPDDTPEVLVPFVGAKAKDLQNGSSTLLQRAARAFAQPCPSHAPPSCAAAAAEVLRQIPDGVVLVAPTTRPSVSAPLGWALSENSRLRMETDMAEQREACDPANGRYAALGALLRLLHPDRVTCRRPE